MSAPRKKSKAWYQQAFCNEWLADSELKDWIKPQSGNRYAAICTVCCCTLTNVNKSALLAHKVTQKHVKNFEARSKTLNINKFLVNWSKSAPRKKSKAWYQQAFCNEWLADSELKDWIKPQSGNRYAAICTVCCCTLTNVNKSALFAHKVTQKHMKNFEARSKTLNINNMSCAGKQKKIHCNEYDRNSLLLKTDIAETEEDFQHVEADNHCTLELTVDLDPSLGSSVDMRNATKISDDIKVKKKSLVKNMEKKTYAQKYSVKWHQDDILKEWVQPVTGNVFKARCRWCKSILDAHYKTLKYHASSAKHMRNSAACFDNSDDEYMQCSQQGGISSRDEQNQRIGSLRNTDSNSFSACSAKKPRKSCHLLNQSTWKQYKQRYRKEWESNPNFQGWITRVEGDDYRARCLYCQVLIRAHHKDLKVHSRTAKHANNVAYGNPNQSLSQMVLGLNRSSIKCRSRMGWRKKRACDSLNSLDRTDALDRPDDSLSAVDSLVNLASSSCFTPPSNVTNLIFPNGTKLDEAIAATLPNNPKALYRVKKMPLIRSDTGSTKHSYGVPNDGPIHDELVTRVVKKVTLWEFLKLKLNRNPVGLRMADMLSEFEALTQQIKNSVHKNLVAVDGSTDHPNGNEEILVVTNKDLADYLELPVGHYRIKDHESLSASFSSVEKSSNRMQKHNSKDVALLTKSHVNPAHLIQLGPNSVLSQIPSSDLQLFCSVNGETKWGLK